MSERPTPVDTTPRWGLSTVDYHVHAVDVDADHPCGVSIARCGHELPGVNDVRDEPPTGVWTVCPSCARWATDPPPREQDRAAETSGVRPARVWLVAGLGSAPTPTDAPTVRDSLTRTWRPGPDGRYSTGEGRHHATWSELRARHDLVEVLTETQ